ncbi:MAG: DUF6531 domain-containing protein, partial [Gammaproteobacteria bacterium]|nr:DUF6531 domain-containing protein [Gammaproteobacteria bacterium]
MAVKPRFSSPYISPVGPKVSPELSDRQRTMTGYSWNALLAGALLAMSPWQAQAWVGEQAFWGEGYSLSVNEACTAANFDPNIGYCEELGGGYWTVSYGQVSGVPDRPPTDFRGQCSRYCNDGRSGGGYKKIVGNCPAGSIWDGQQPVYQTCYPLPPCEPGTEYDEPTGQCGSAGASNPLKETRACPWTGNPINPATGNKYQVERDYRGAGPAPLVFER